MYCTIRERPCNTDKRGCLLGGYGVCEDRRKEIMEDNQRRKEGWEALQLLKVRKAEV